MMNFKVFSLSFFLLLSWSSQATTADLLAGETLLPFERKQYHSAPFERLQEIYSEIAGSTTIYKEEDHTNYLYAPSRERLISELTQLHALAVARGAQVDSLAQYRSRIETRELGYYRVVVDSLMVDFQRVANERQILIDGPNCFNTALLHQGIGRTLRYVSDAEFSHILGSRLCHAVPAGEQRGGDMRVIISNAHADTMVTSSLIFYESRNFQ